MFIHSTPLSSLVIINTCTSEKQICRDSGLSEFLGFPQMKGLCRIQFSKLISLLTNRPLGKPRCWWWLLKLILNWLGGCGLGRVKLEGGTCECGNETLGFTKCGGFLDQLLLQKGCVPWNYTGADKSLARPGRKQATATEDFDVHIS
jgi:hypothetical protein